MAQAQRLADDLKKAVAQAERARIERQSQLKLLEVEAAAQEAELQRDLDQAKTKLQKLARKRQDTVSAHERQQAQLNLMLEAREATTEKDEVDNADNYLRYAAKRQKIRKDLENKALSGTEILPPASSAPASGKSPHIKTHEISLKGLVFHPEEPIDFDLQESWLWHGTRKEGVEGITSSDFDIKRAGSAAGTMFGCGLYFAESCMKSDEYTVADERGWYPLILCRVTCGRFFYCDWKRPFDHTDQLEDACHHKGFHCVLGDREKVSGTYREYIVFDNDQVYPEYIVWYSK